MLWHKLIGSKSVVSDPVGDAQYTTPGTFSWTAPAGVTSVCVVCVGGGGGPAINANGASGAGGGGLGWKNNITVVPGDSYTVVVGAGGTRVTSGTAPAGGESYFINTSTVRGGGGSGGISAGDGNPTGGTFTGDGGGNGGNGGNMLSLGNGAGGGGGAGGYTGAGGAGGNNRNSNIDVSGSAGLGGGGGGGGGCGAGDSSGGGGGVGLYGAGSNGAGGGGTTADGRGGFGGSGGGNATFASTATTAENVYGTSTPSTPGLYGGGGCGADNTVAEQSNGAGGAVRIIWGAGRAFPSTNVGLIQFISYDFTNPEGATSFTVAKPTGTQSGDFMLAYFFHHSAGVTLTGPSGWTLLTSDNASTNSAAVYYYTAGGSEPATYSFSSNSPANNGAAILTFRGGTGAVDVFGAFGAGLGTAVFVPSITPTVDGLNIAFIGAELSNQSVTVKPARFAEIFQEGETPFIAAYSDEYLASEGATGAASFTLNTSAGHKSIQLQIY